MLEVCQQSMASGAKFFVYLHKRPDGTVFYVGKGTRTRAMEFAPTRRTLHHTNVVRKYGRDSIAVELIPCMYEKEAFELERVLIAIYATQGKIVNLTAGGEGASGRRLTEEQKARHSEAVKRGWLNRARAPKLDLVKAEKPQAVCINCNSPMDALRVTKKFCGERCAKQHASHRLGVVKGGLYRNNKTGARGVYQRDNGRWMAIVSTQGKASSIGTFDTKELAVAAREAYMATNA